MNELVQILYKQAVKRYERLHLASIQVRYSVGLDPVALPLLVDDLTAIEELEPQKADRT